MKDQIKILSNTKGQASLELMSATMALVAALCLLFSSCYVLVAHFQIKFESQRSLICLTSESVPFCENQLKLNLKKTVVFGKIKNLRLEKTLNQRSISLTFDLNNFIGPRFLKNYTLKASF